MCERRFAPKEIVPVAEVLDENQMRTETWTFLSLMSALSTPEDSLKWCAKHRLIKNTVECPKCNKPLSFVVLQKGADKKRWSCSICKVNRSVRPGSFFVRSSLSLDQILALIYFWAIDLPQTVISHELGLSSKSVIDWCNFCREECAYFVARSALQIGGLDENGEAIFVEIDESKYFREKYYDDDDGNEGPWLLGGVERGSGKCFLVEVPDRTASTLQEEIMRNILPGSHIVSYEWAAYANIDSIEQGIYRHSVIDRSNFVNPSNRDIHLQTVRNMWARLKRRLNRHGTTRALLPSYLSEFVFRNAFRGQDIFSNVLNCIAENYDI